ncbi:MAG: ribonucleotide reductase N-terminal alpha domain-containing protein, partial [Nitrospirota bacterium]
MKDSGHSNASEVSPQISPNALRVLQKRYLAKDENGKVIETPEGMFRRVAVNMAQADGFYGATPEEIRKAEEEFYALMARLDFLPNSPTLMNAGRPLQQLAACFVLPVEDSIGGIYDTLKHQALIHQTGGGTGFSFSRLRPKDDMVRSTGGVASGPVSFMKVYNQSTEHIKQGGTRRGANMGILRVDHPDILEFITCKTNTKEVTNFNISVAVTDAFLSAALKGEMYDLVSPRNGKAVRQLNARKVLATIAEAAWRNGEPGLFFIDQANRTNPTPHYAMIEATNPCGEQPLLPYESCNLGSINVETHLVQAGDGRCEIDWAHMERSIRTSV